MSSRVLSINLFEVSPEHRSRMVALSAQRHRFESFEPVDFTVSQDRAGTREMLAEEQANRVSGLPDLFAQRHG